MKKVVTTVSATAMSGDSTAMAVEAWPRRASSSRTIGTALGQSVMLVVDATHQHADAVRRHGLGRIGRRQAPAGEHRYAVGDLKNLVEVLADHQHGGAGLCEVDQRLADRAGCAGVDAPGRLVDDEDA